VSIYDYLTDRQAEHVRRRCAGETLAEIAAAQGSSLIAEGTHRRNALDRLKLTNDEDLCRYAASGELPPGLPEPMLMPIVPARKRTPVARQISTWRRYPLE
jgi:hypothetical protein